MSKELPQHPELRLIAAARAVVKLEKEINKVMTLVSELIDSVEALDEHEGKLPRRHWNYPGPLRNWPAGSWNNRKRVKK